MRRFALAAAGLTLVAQAVAGAQAPPRQTPPPPQTTRPTPPARPGTQTPTPPATGRPQAPPTGTPRPNAPATPSTPAPTTLPAPAPEPPRQPAVPLPPVTGVIAPDALTGHAYVAGKAPGPAVTLSQAVDLVLKHQPRVAIAGQNVLSARANLLQARGVFDPVFTFAPGADYTQQPVAPGFLRQQKNNRTLMKQLHVGFTRANIQLRDILAGTRTSLPTCPLAFDFEFGSNAFTNDGIDPSEVAVTGIDRDVFPFVIADLEESLGGIDLRKFCAAPSATIRSTRSCST